MADVYLNSVDGDDADDGSTWALADATLVASLVAAGAGGTTYMSDNHAESQAGIMTLQCSTTRNAPNRVICVDDAGAPEPPTALATTGSLTTSANVHMDIEGFGYFYGVKFNTFSIFDVLQHTNAVGHVVLRKCVITCGTLSGGVIRCGSASASLGQFVELVDTDIAFGHANQNIQFHGGRTVIRGGSIGLTGTVPTTLITTVNGRCASVLIDGCDLSGLSGTLISASIVENTDITVRNCQLHESVSFASGNPVGTAAVTLLNSDSADTIYRFERVTYGGNETQETTIVLDASDGTTTSSRKLVSTANATPEMPMASARIVGPYNTTVASSQTATIEIVTDNVTLTDAECWIRLTYMGTSGFPLALTVDDRDADWPLGTPANQTTSSAAWTTTGLVTPVKQALSVSFTAQEEGYIYAEVMLGKASTTVYVNPKIDVT